MALYSYGLGPRAFQTVPRQHAPAARLHTCLRTHICTHASTRAYTHAYVRGAEAEPGAVHQAFAHGGPRRARQARATAAVSRPPAPDVQGHDSIGP